MRRVHVSVEGRVQGVFYRATCVELARELGLAGWIRNTLDGRVEAEFEGEPASIQAMLGWCREGPAHAYVTSIDITEEPPTGETTFRVAR
ncbi:MAG TPA: acylphosphatase [Actinomycetota bacterium]